MMLDSYTQNIINSFLQKKIQDLSGIYLFGSFVNEQATPESDMDIAFLTRQKISPIKKWEIQEELASLIGKDIDLIDIKNSSVILRTEIIENGKRIFEGNRLECELFEMTTYSMYSDLNEARIEILNDLKEKYGRDS